MSASSPAVAKLADALSGRLLRPGEDGYDDARISFNGTIDRRPALIACCLAADDVQLAVGAALELDIPISVRGGGHSVAGHGIGDGAMMIDLSRMRRVDVDAGRRLGRVEGGCLWDDVDAATQAVGLAVPGGTYGDTGVAGLALGGGIGWLLGTTGLTCDNLVRAEVVTGTGERVVAGDGGDEELLWALRGGGGNFGVVTSFEFMLHECGQLVGGHISFALDDLRAVLECVQAMTDEAPDELVMMPWIVGITGLAEIDLAFRGSLPASERVLAPLRQVAHVVEEHIRPMTYLEVQAMNGRLPFGLRHYWKGHFVGRLDDSALDAVVDGATTVAGGGRSGILLEAITGVARRVPAESAAFGARDAGWNVSALAIWDDPADDDAQIAWARRLADGLEVSSLSGGGYVNYIPPDETPARVLAAYGPKRFARLAAVKRRYDPENRFRFNLNIPPA